MSYVFAKTLSTPFEETVAQVTAALKADGFGILTEIDIQETLKKKLDVDLPPYVILGACNPPLAYEALQAEPLIGTMLPCNVVVRQHADAGVEVAAVDPMASMQAVDNPALGHVAEQVAARLKKIVADL